jgi:hypothetical protein
MNHVIPDHEYICPVCGIICTSLTAYHLHFKEKHEEAK